MTIQKAQNEIANLQFKISEVESIIKMVELRSFDSRAANDFIFELEDEKKQHIARIEKIQNWINEQIQNWVPANQ